MIEGIQELEAWLARFGADLGWPLEAVLKLALAAVAGGLVGLERELRGRQAGFRTHMLVCLGSALVMIVSMRFATHPWGPVPVGVNINIDPARIAYGVMTGVGFLGAGTIVHTKGSVRGLTTAAALWCVAAIGLSAGFGMYLLCIIVSLLVVAALWIFDYVEDWLPRLRIRTVTIRRTWKSGVVAETVKRLDEHGLKTLDANFQRSDDMKMVDIGLRIGFTRRAQYFRFERQVAEDEDFELMSTREV